MQYWPTWRPSSLQPQTPVSSSSFRSKRRRNRSRNSRWGRTPSWRNGDEKGRKGTKGTRGGAHIYRQTIYRIHTEGADMTTVCQRWGEVCIPHSINSVRNKNKIWTKHAVWINANQRNSAWINVPLHNVLLFFKLLKLNDINQFTYPFITFCSSSNY